MRTKVSEEGVFIPKELLEGISEVDIRKQNGVIVVIPTGKREPNNEIGQERAPKRPQFGSGHGLIKISDNFDEPLEDFTDYM